MELDEEAIRDARTALDIHNIKNVMGRYEYYHTAGMQEESLALFAAKTPGVKLEIAHLGIYDGIDSVRRFFLAANRLGPERAGLLFVHTLTTPVIEVAKDRETAKGVWISPGVETGGPMKEDGRSAWWCWVKYGIDFVREDGIWKIWKFGMFRLFMAKPGESWAATPPGAPDGTNPSLTQWELERVKLLAFMPPAARPDRTNNYSWVYSPTATVENIPAPPAPYESWDEANAYVK